ncbi:MAG: septum formation initiator family protein [Rhizobiales bacterium]|nr:septum formation initiator family protein [Hyphomicrobiales bacterium]
MVTRNRLRTFLTAFALYVLAALLIGYFGINAFTGNRGLRAQKDLDLETTDLDGELMRLREERRLWERRVALLRSEGLDPDMLDERARALLNYAHPADLTLFVKPQ